MADYDAIVIGSGAGGLSAALKLSRSELSVLLLEAMPAFGGYLNPFHRKGYTFDTGLHLMGELAKGDDFWKLLDELGISDGVRFVELNPEGFDRFIFPDFELRCCKGKERFKERLVSVFPKEKKGINKFFEVYDKIIKAVQASVSLEGGALQMISFIIKHPVMIKYSRVPYQKLLDEVTSDKRLQAVLAANWVYYGVPPAKASVIIALQVWNHYLKGAYYPVGGSGAFRDAFVNALKKNGVDLKRLSRVVSIDKKDNEFVVEIDSGETHTAKVVISDADPFITLGELLKPKLVPSKIESKVRQLRPSEGVIYTFIGTGLDLPSLGITDANIMHYEHYDINKIYEDSLLPTPPEGVPVFFITSPSVKDPDGLHAPEGHHTIEIMTATSYKMFEKWAKMTSMKRGEEYEALKEGLGERLIKAAEKYVPGLTQHLDFVEYATPLSNEYWVNAVRGASYGPEQTPDQMGPGRFATCTSGIQGLFLAGAGTVGGGIMPCVLSGIMAGSKAVQYLKT